jgi:CheY-like chemotaxis protein
MPIIIADDDPDTVTTQGMLFRQAGFDVIECLEGKDVMPLVEQHHPRVVLLDLSMPGMDGFAIADELRDNPDLRPKLLVAVTGYGDPETVKRTAEAGFDRHMLKPVEFSELLSLVESFL